MDINAANLSALNTTYSTVFNQAFESAMPKWGKIALKTQSTNAQTIYRWMAMLAGMREFKGEITLDNISNNGLTVVNSKYYDAVAVSADDIKDDTYGTYSPLMAQMGAGAAQHPDQLVADLLNDAFTATDYTTSAFFHTTKYHVPGVTKGTNMSFSNKGTAVLSQANFEAGLAALRAIKTPQGIALNKTLDLALVVPPALDYTARTIVEAGTVSAGGQNVSAGLAEVVCLPELTSSTAWFLINRANAIKPLIFQEREAPTFSSLTSPTDDHVFKKDEYVYKVQGRWAASYALPQFAYGSTGAG